MQSEGDETVVAVTVVEGVKAIPDEVSRVLACNCKAIGKRGNCSCMSLKISCTEFCACKSFVHAKDMKKEKNLLCKVEQLLLSEILL